MLRLNLIWLALLSPVFVCCAAEPTTDPAPVAPAKKTLVYVLPVREEINKPTLYILDRKSVV